MRSCLSQREVIHGVIMPSEMTLAALASHPRPRALGMPTAPLTREPNMQFEPFAHAGIGID
jgi:hypothetical protein